VDLKLAVLPGDGIGPEVTACAMDVLESLSRRFGFGVTTQEGAIGWSAIQAGEVPLPPQTLAACRDADAVFLGAVGHPDAEGLPIQRRPEAGLLRLRAELGCWVNLRPLVVSDALLGASALRPERVRGTDLVVVRELGGGLYYGEPRGTDDGRAWDTLVYTEDEVRRIVRLAMDIAGRRRGHVTSIDKANVLEASRLWRRVVSEEAAAQDEVEVEHMYVDRAAMELVLHPTRFDVIVTSNLFGDVLSDEAGALAGSLGVLGSASLGGVSDLYEPVHGSAPDLSGRGVANPVGALASISLMLRHTCSLPEAAEALDRAVERTLHRGLRTVDLVLAGEGVVGSAEFTRAVLSEMDVGG
jgi:3-isopropylmalate dehydrogenase